MRSAKSIADPIKTRIHAKNSALKAVRGPSSQQPLLSGEVSAWTLLTYQNALTLARFMRDAGVDDDDRDFRRCIQQVIRFHDSHFVPVTPDTEMFIQHCH